jgi:hypothetical protein
MKPERERKPATALMLAPITAGLLVYAGMQEQQGRRQQQTCPQQQMYARNRI